MYAITVCCAISVCDHRIMISVWEEDTITAHHRLEVTGGEAAVQVLVVVVAMEAMLGISQLVFW